MWTFLCEQRGARYVRAHVPLPVESAAQIVEAVWSQVTDRTRVLFLSHLTSTTALIFPVAELVRRARDAGITTVIDGAHAPGQIDVDLDALGADFYVGNCHKWLCAPKGAGFLHARPEHHALLEPTVISWGYAAGTGGHSGFDAYLGRSVFERRMQWQGTRDIAAWLAVPAALEFQARHDWPTVRARCHVLARRALQALTERHGLAPIAADNDWAQMVAIPVPAQDPDALRQRLLAESRIEILVTTHAGRTFVRLSVQGYNTDEDIERLVAAPALQ
jgi:isopenicillin-N epimerase